MCVAKFPCSLSFEVNSQVQADVVRSVRVVASSGGEVACPLESGAHNLCERMHRVGLGDVPLELLDLFRGYSIVQPGSRGTAFPHRNSRSSEYFTGGSRRPAVKYSELVLLSLQKKIVFFFSLLIFSGLG